MPNRDGSGPQKGGGPGTGRGLGRCLGRTGSKIGGGRTGGYVGFIEILIPVVSTLLKIFRKPKNP